jgi:hypothetical protein
MNFALTRCTASLGKKLGATYSDLDKLRYEGVMSEHFRTKTNFKPHFALVDEKGKVWLWATDESLLAELRAKKGKTV